MGRVYDLRAWKRVRLEQLARSPLCEMCKAIGRTVPALHVDHIVPVSEGGAWFDADNLQSLCHACHSLKTLKDKGGNPNLGVTLDGVPIDPTHPWHGRGGGG